MKGPDREITLALQNSQRNPRVERRFNRLLQLRWVLAVIKKRFKESMTVKPELTWFGDGR